MNPSNDMATNSIRVSPGPSPDWLRRMREDYQATGSYRSEDVRRLLGDQTLRVEVGPKSNPASFFSQP